MNTIYIEFVLSTLGAAILCPLAARVHAKWADVVAVATSAAALLSCVYSAYFHLRPAIFDKTDMLSFIMLFVIQLIVFLVIVHCSKSRKYTDSRGTFFGLLMLCATAMNGIVITNDFFMLYVFIEVLAVSTYALITFDETRNQTEASLKYFFMAVPATIFLMFGIALLVMHTGDTSYQSVIMLIEQGKNYTALTLIFAVMLCGFMIKSGLVPFHGWTPDVYEASPTPVSALLAGISTKVAGMFPILLICSFLGRMYPEIQGNIIGQALMVIGVLSILVGAFGAIAQMDFKRMLAYSSISQMGYIVLAAGLGTPLAIAGAIFHFLNHATFKATLFLNAAAVKTYAGTTSMKDLGGLQERMPVTSWTSVIAAMSTAGIPPLSGFWSKLLIIVALWVSGYTTFAFIALLASVITLAYFIVMQKRVFFGVLPSTLKEVKEAPLQILLPVIALSVIMVIVGVGFPWIYSEFIAPATGRLFQW